MLPPDKQKFLEFLSARNARMNCEICNADKWTTGDVGRGLVVAPPSLNENGSIDLGRSVPAYTIVCTNCGNMRFHAVAVVSPELLKQNG